MMEYVLGNPIGKLLADYWLKSSSLGEPEQEDSDNELDTDGVPIGRKKFIKRVENGSSPNYNLLTMFEPGMDLRQ